MARSTTTNRMRLPLAAAFRRAFEAHDSKRRAETVDEAGERVVIGRQAAGRNIVSESTLETIVSGDIETLMNTTHLAASENLDEFEAVRRSILNFGIPDVVHRTIDEEAVAAIETDVAVALACFEPRLDPASIRVSQDLRIDKAELKVRFVVRADLRCDPLNRPVEFVADVERDIGKISVTGR